MDPNVNIAPSRRNVNPPAPSKPAPAPISEVKPEANLAAQNDLYIGQIVEYTEMVDSLASEERRQNPRLRAAQVIFILDDGHDRLPVLRVFVPRAPALAEMPAQGLLHTAVGINDLEVYAPRFHHDARVQNTWRPISPRRG